MNNSLLSRRNFLATAGAVSLLPETALPQTGSASATGLPTRPLGRTGVNVSIMGVGGAHLGRFRSDDDAIRFLHTALDNGMTFMDNAWEYNKGRSEEIMGKALAMDGRRKNAFLMTKVCSREYKGAMEQLEESLRRLQTDHIDLWQFHECNYYNDPEWILDKGGLRAAEEARKAGKVRFIGFTGHKSPAIHLRMLDLRFAWDAAQMPNNILDSGFLSFRREVMPVCQKKNVAVVGMKGCGGDGRMLKDGGVALEEAYRYFLSQPVSVQVVGLSSLEELQRALEIGRSFRPMTDSEVTTISKRLRDIMGDGRYELFKTSKQFDSGYHRQQHGFDLTRGV
jgi:aryl-alcohol dehydrogenase-like predicted oxidoreductase